MQISKIDKADPKTFQVLKGYYNYAQDKNFFYEDVERIKGFNPNKTKFLLSADGKIAGISSAGKEYKFEE